MEALEMTSSVVDRPHEAQANNSAPVYQDIDLMKSENRMYSPSNMFN